MASLGLLDTTLLVRGIAQQLEICLKCSLIGLDFLHGLSSSADQVAAVHPKLGPVASVQYAGSQRSVPWTASHVLRHLIQSLQHRTYLQTSQIGDLL